MSKPVPVNKTTTRANLNGKLWEVFKVTEWRSGCIYKTKSLGFIVAEFSKPAVKFPDGFQNSIAFRESGKLLDAFKQGIK